MYVCMYVCFYGLGDDGAVSGSAKDSPLYCRYAPSFPATSPYVLAVGATMVCLLIVYVCMSILRGCGSLLGTGIKCTGGGLL